MTIGPLQLTVIRFDGNDFKSGILPELKAVRKAGVIRLLDLLFVTKNEEGNLSSVEISDLDDDEARGYGAVIGGLIGLGAAGASGAAIGAEMGALALSDRDYGITPEDLDEIAGNLPPGSSALLALFEHTWAIGLKRSILNAGGGLVAQGLLDPATLMGIGAELTAAVTAAERDESSGRC